MATNGEDVFQDEKNIIDDDEYSFQHTGIPEQDAWFISRLFFLWQNQLFKRAATLFKRGEALQQHDLLPLMAEDHSGRLANIFEDAFFDEEKSSSSDGGKDKKKKSYPRIRRAILKVLGWKFYLAAFIKMINTGLQFTFPLLLNGILTFMEEYQAGIIQKTDAWHVRNRGYWLSALLLLAMGAKSITENNYFQIANRGAFHTKAAISLSVYNKALRLSNVERQSTTLGQTVNLMQVDTTKIESFIPQVHVLWDGVFQIVGYMAILYSLIGPSCFAGLLVMVLSVPIQGVVMNKLFGLNRKMVKHTDARVESINEALQGIQGVKMFTWEENVSKKVGNFRKEELKHLKNAAYLRGFSRAYMGALPGIVTVISFIVYAFTKSAEISASKLFAAIVAFDQLRFPLLFYPMALALLVQAQVSAGRIDEFLEMGEITKSVATGKGIYTRENGTGSGITIKGADIYWSDPAVPLKSNDDTSTVALDTSLSGSTEKDDSGHDASATDKELADIEESTTKTVHYPKAALEDISININSGELCAVVGRVASGKSSLCSAILNETFLDRGEISLRGEVAYAAQSPWILNATVRENILFGKPMDEERYGRVLKACQLEHDLAVLEDGDLTDIGEKGINLSGGQKARVSVARAAYADADTIILDDPLSALDPEVAAALFHDCIDGDLMAGKTRLLVTNQLQFLGSCDHIVVLKKGRVMEDGKATDLLAKKDSEVNRLVANIAGGKSSKNVTKTDDSVEKEDAIAKPNRRSSIATSKSTKLLTKEERNVGAVALSVYLKYAKAGGGYVRFSLVFFGYIIATLNQTASVSWVSYWTSDGTYERNDKNFYLGIYFALAVMLGVFSFVESYLLSLFGVNASEKLHTDLLKAILRAPQSFFDTTPLGRILSRFSKDVYQVDLELTDSIEIVLSCVLGIVVGLISIVVVMPWFGIAILPLGVIYFHYLQYFRSVSRETKRLESISRSPVYAQFSETLGGLSTIRAYGQPDRFMNEFEEKINTNTQAQYNNKSADRWLSTRLEFMGATIAGTTAFLASYLVISGSSIGIGGRSDSLASFAGLSLTYAVSLTGLLNWSVQSFSQMENSMNGSERILYYTEETPQEAPWSTTELEDCSCNSETINRRPHELAIAAGGGKPEKIRPEWPEKGAIELKNLCMRYRSDTPLVLKGLNISIAGGERIGVVGRTGSGKSSLLLSLLRLVEPALSDSIDEYKSPISIDGVDILRVGLRDLRSKLGIIPQNPVLFSGTIRSNMDPFNEYTAEEIWKALEQCHLKDSVDEMPGQLEASVAEYGQNLSNGMRQMLVLGRALLRKCKILLLDEATASVDIETDKEIQRTLREAFSGCTVLTIAHRINTIMDSDKILVLKDGRAEEFAAPTELLQDETSIFSDIVRHAQADDEQ